MGNLTDKNEWTPQVRQIEPGDSVDGGAGAPINECLGGINNRVVYLKAEVEKNADTKQAGRVQLSSATNSDAEDKAATPKAVKEAIGLAKSASMPVGAVVAFPRSVANPEGYLKADGSTFTQATYPDLYRVLGSNKLPDLTRSDVGMTAYWPVGDIPNGWVKYDEIATRVTQSAYLELYRKLVAQYGSIDAVPKADDRFIRNAAGGLTVGTQQGDAIRNITGEAKYGYDGDTVFDPAAAASSSAIYYPDRKAPDTVNNMSVFSNAANNWRPLVFDASRSVPTANENRPKALAMVLCIKARDTLDDVVMWIKAYGKVTNAGVLDASTLAADLQRKANRDEVAPKSHTHRAAEINDFAEAVAALTVYQKIGTFDICKLPDGTQIESGTVRIQNHANSPTARVLTWPLAFVDAPVVVATMSGPEGNVRDIWVTIDNRQSNQSAVHYWLHEPVYNTPDVTVNFVAVGRWK